MIGEAEVRMVEARYKEPSALVRIEGENSEEWE